MNRFADIVGEPFGEVLARQTDTQAVDALSERYEGKGIDAVVAIAEKHGLKVVEDAAQAHGAAWKGKTAGTFGDCACYSFYPGKNLGAYGDAGAVVTDSDDLRAWVSNYCNHGRHAHLLHGMVGVNSRLDGFQAAVLSVKLRHLEAWTARRREIAARYGRGTRFGIRVDRDGVTEAERCLEALGAAAV